MALADIQNADLTAPQTRKLRSLGHNLTPLVHVGKAGVTPALLEAVDAALLTHELVKIRLNQNVTMDRQEAAGQLAEGTGSTVAQVLGAVVLLFRPHPDEPKIFP